MNYIKLFEDFNSYINKDVNELMNYLSKYSIPFSKWGTGKSKTIEDLHDELINKECSIIEDGDSITRIIEFVGIKVYYRDDKGDIYFLKEDRQEFNDGRTRRRNMPTSVAEKMKYGESPLIAGVRGIKEELNVDVSSSQLTKKKDIRYNGSSLSYPGLRSKYKGYEFTCFFDKTQFNEEGYIEVQRTKKTYFKWVKI